MAGYAANATLHGAEPQFAFASTHAYRPLGIEAPGPSEASSTADGALIEQLELVGRPINTVITDWLASIGESWSQLTFFLFDPESWR